MPQAMPAKRKRKDSTSLAPATRANTVHSVRADRQTSELSTPGASEPPAKSSKKLATPRNPKPIQPVDCKYSSANIATRNEQLASLRYYEAASLEPCNLSANLPSFSSDLDLIVGFDHEKISTTRAVLETSCTYFKELLIEGDAEDSKPIQFPHRNPETFHRFLRWAHSPRIPLLTSERMASKEVNPVLSALISSYRFGLSVQCPEFTVACLDKLFEYFKTHDSRLPLAWIKFVYERTQPGSPFRKMVLDHTVFQLRSEGSISHSAGEDLSSLPKEFLLDYYGQSGGVLKDKSPFDVTPSLRCARYHVHGVDELEKSGEPLVQEDVKPEVGKEEEEGEEEETKLGVSREANAKTNSEAAIKAHHVETDFETNGTTNVNPNIETNKEANTGANVVSDPESDKEVDTDGEVHTNDTTKEASTSKQADPVEEIETAADTGLAADQDPQPDNSKNHIGEDHVGENNKSTGDGESRQSSYGLSEMWRINSKFDSPLTCAVTGTISPSEPETPERASTTHPYETRQNEVYHPAKQPFDIGLDKQFFSP